MDWDLMMCCVGTVVIDPEVLTLSEWESLSALTFNSSWTFCCPCGCVCVFLIRSARACVRSVLPLEHGTCAAGASVCLFRYA